MSPITYLRIAYKRIRYGYWLMMMGVPPLEAKRLVDDAQIFGHLD